MTFSKLLSAVALFASSVVPFAVPAFGDTYKIINLGNANGNGIYGIDASGDVVVRSNSGCGVYGASCFKIYDEGVLDSMSLSAPTMDYDNGTSCKPISLTTNGACNNGRDAYGASLSSSFGLFTGDGDILFGGSVDQIVMNSVGDIAWTDGMNECNYEAIDMSTSPVPEPNTLLLLVTGVVGVAGTVRRSLVHGRIRR